jgi:hypothetical protein
MAPSEELENLHLHTAHIQALATINLRNRNALLASAGPQFVRALSTLARILHANGFEFPHAHLRRARRMISRNTAARTKQVLVSGEPGKVSRGGGLFSKMAKAAVAAGIVAATGAAAVQGGRTVMANRQARLDAEYWAPQIAREQENARIEAAKWAIGGFAI